MGLEEVCINCNCVHNGCYTLNIGSGTPEEVLKACTDYYHQCFKNETELTLHSYKRITVFKPTEQKDVISVILDKNDGGSMYKVKILCATCGVFDTRFVNKKV